MKNTCWLLLGALLSTSLLAQQATNTPPSAPIETPAAAPAATLTPVPAKTNTPATKAGTKKAGKKKAAAKKKPPMPALKTVPLVPGPAVVVASNVNVRGQAKLNSEVVTRVTKGQPVTVIQEIVRNNSGPDEPSAWAKVVLPPNAHTWVNTAFINSSNQTVKPKKLNVRSGPGENYSVIGLLHAGDAVKTVTTKGDWTEIEAPTDTYGFMAAQYLSQEAAVLAAAAPKPTETPTAPPTTTPATTPATAPPTTPPPATTPPTTTPTEPAPTPATVAAAPAVAPPPTEAPAVPPPTTTAALTQPPAVTNVASASPAQPEVEEPLPPRVVQREGIVRGMTSIQAPSKFALISPENGKNIDYLYTTSEELDLRRYKGLRIIVTGEEGLDERWGNTPVLTIQKIQIVE